MPMRPRNNACWSTCGLSRKAAATCCVSANSVARTLVGSPHPDRQPIDLLSSLKTVETLVFKNVAPEVVVCKNLFRRPLTWELLRQKIDARDADFFQTEFIEYLMIPEDFGTLFMKDLSNLETPIDFEKIGELNAFVQSLQQSDREQMLVTLGNVVVGCAIIQDRALESLKLSLKGRVELDRFDMLKNSKMMEETKVGVTERNLTFIKRRKILGRYLALLMSLDFFWDCSFVGAIQNAREYLQLIINLLRRDHQKVTVD